MSGEADSVGFAAPPFWVHARGVMQLDRPRVMGIVNVTPDSFSDGGQLHDGTTVDRSATADRIAALLRQGADIVDIGGESTRPGAAQVDPDEEIARVLPAVSAAVQQGAVVSIDTRRARVASAALRAGAVIVNDVSGLADPDMAEVVAEAEAGLVIGHLRGQPSTMQRDIRFVDLLREVTDELAVIVRRAQGVGIERPRMLVDPGIGFGKTAEQSAALVAASGWLRQATGCAVLIGASRKSFLGALSGAGPHERMPGSLAAAVVAAECGASVLRVHDVAQTVQALAVARSIRAAYEDCEAQARAGGGH
jgi:dihydropteroate synthase